MKVNKPIVINGDFDGQGQTLIRTGDFPIFVCSSRTDEVVIQNVELRGPGTRPLIWMKDFHGILRNVRWFNVKGVGAIFIDCFRTRLEDVAGNGCKWDIMVKEEQMSNCLFTIDKALFMGPGGGLKLQGNRTNVVNVRDVLFCKNSVGMSVQGVEQVKLDGVRFDRVKNGLMVEDCDVELRNTRFTSCGSWLKTKGKVGLKMEVTVDEGRRS